jgi:hypothetical protein
MPVLGHGDLFQVSLLSSPCSAWPFVLRLRSTAEVVDADLRNVSVDTVARPIVERNRKPAARHMLLSTAHTRLIHPDFPGDFPFSNGPHHFLRRHREPAFELIITSFALPFIGFVFSMT